MSCVPVHVAGSYNQGKYYVDSSRHDERIVPVHVFYYYNPGK